MSNYENVGIFWDLENCALQSVGLPAHQVVDKLRELAHRYGILKTLKAYIDLQSMNSPKSVNQCSDLQACGVSLIHCPHNGTGRKDVVDKVMLVDMMAYMADNLVPATIILISGDRDFAYGVSVLRQRRYRIVVVVPYAAHDSLTFQASETLRWDVDILGKPPMERMNAASHDPQYPTTQTPVPAADASPVMGLRPRRRSSAAARTMQTSTPVPHYPQRAPTPNALYGSEATAPSGPARGDYDARPPSSRAIQRPPSRAGYALFDDVPQIGSSQYDAYSAQSRPLSPISSKTANSSLSRQSIASEDTVGHNSLNAAIENVNNVLTPVPIVGADVIQERKVTLRASTGNLIEEASLSDPYIRPVTTGPDSQSPAARSQIPLADKTPTHSAMTSPNGDVSRPQSSLATPMPPATPGPTRLKTAPDITSPPTEPASPAPIPPAVLAYRGAGFRLLATILEELRRDGHTQPLRSHVSVQLKQRNENIYMETQTSRFRYFCDAAVKAGVVKIGGSEGAAWISLPDVIP